MRYLTYIEVAAINQYVIELFSSGNKLELNHPVYLIRQ